jgi:alpha-mannosidase
MKTMPADRRKQTGRTPTGHYIASTHWDREWYESFQFYRFRLVDVIDRVQALLAKDPEFKSFQLDGQVITVEDYLAIRPEQRAALARWAQAGRLQLGPWYVLPDEFLVSGESLVRNLQRGHRIAAEFGPVLKVGFVCDIFGHNSQLPQIFRGFGIDCAVVWRGCTDADHTGLFRWQAADGSEVLAYAFEDRGYGDYYFEVREHGRQANGQLDHKKGLAGLRHMFELGAARTPGSEFVFFDGLDHVPPEPTISKLHAKARAAGLNVGHSDFTTYFAAVRKRRLALRAIQGELRAPGVTGRHLIPGVLSSRIYLKQRNAACENLLTKWAEPFGALAAHLGEAAPPGFLDLAWRYLITNHPHDSICGCSIDQVHRDMEYRYDQCRLLGERSLQMSLRAVADRTPRPELKDAEDFAVTVFNPGATAIDGTVELPLYFDRETKNRFQEWFGYEPIVGFRLFDPKGREVPAQRLGVTKLQPVKTYDALAGFEGAKSEEVRVAAPLQIPPHGWTTLVCRPTKDRTRTTGSQLVDDHTMENEHLRVAINPNGTLDLTHRASGVVYRNLLTVEERADIGDGWYHGTAVNDEIGTSIAAGADVALLHDGFAQTTFRVRVTLHVPACFVLDKNVMQRSPEFVPLVVTSWLTLRAGAPLLDVRTEVENTARDHRVRMLLPSGVPVATYFADSPYDVVERPIALRPDSHTLFEPEVETKPQYSFTAVNDGTRGLAVISTGQPESAVRDLPDRPIALTLFRGFQRTVSEEREDGGQMLGRTAHRYAIYPHAGPLPAAELFRMGQALANGVRCVYTSTKRLKLPLPAPTLPAAGSWLKPGPGPLIVTALKRTEDGAAIVLRVFNPTAEPAEQTFESLARIRTAHLANLLEEPGEPLTPRGRTLTITAQPRQIVTVRLELSQ